MRLIFLNRFFWPDHSATSQMLADLAFALADTSRPGARDVILITSRQTYEAPDARLAPRERHANVQIIRVWTTRFGRYTLLGRAVDYVTFCVAAALALWRTARRGDAVVCKTDPPLLSVLITPVARLRGAQVVNWLQDIYPEIAEALGVQLYGLGRPLRLLRTWSLRTAAANVVLGERMEKRVRALAGSGANITTIPNWADGRLVQPVARQDNPLRRAWGLGDAFVVGYAGNLGRAHDSATMLEAIAWVERQGPGPIRWLFIGDGRQLRALRGDVEARGLTTVLFQPYQPRERLAQTLSVPDVHLVTLRPELEGLIVPSKIYGVLAAGRPAIFIGDADGEVGRLLARSGCGQSIAQGDAAALGDLVLAWSRDSARIEAMGRLARSVFTASFDKPQAVASWERLLARLAQRWP